MDPPPFSAWRKKIVKGTQLLVLAGHQPLSWTARANIALDAASGIEYIHDHTKARYVHRDIKTSNILLDQGLRAKVKGNWFKQTLLSDASTMEVSYEVSFQAFCLCL